MSRAFNRVLWLIATWKVWRPRLYLAWRALLGIPGEVVLRGQWTGDTLEVRGPTVVRIVGRVKTWGVGVRP